MKILKAMIAVEGGNSIFAASAIEWQGKIWIVPTWLENPEAGWKIPERLVCISDQTHQKMGPSWQFDYSVSMPIPKSVLYDPGPLPPESRYVVVYRPDIRFPIPRGIH